MYICYQFAIKKQSIFIYINQISLIIGLMFQVYNPDNFQRDQGVTENVKYEKNINWKKRVFLVTQCPSQKILNFCLIQMKACSIWYAKHQ